MEASENGREFHKGEPGYEEQQLGKAPAKPSRFDYIAYDKISQRDQEIAKEAAMALESVIEMIMPEMTNRPKENAINALEECYMWIGKGIRDQQIKSNASTVLQEERVNS